MYSQFVFSQILSGDFLCGNSCVDELVEILLCEGGDVELCARTSKHILVFASNSLSLSLLCLASFHIVHSYLYAWYSLFVCHTCVEPRELHIAPQLLFRGI